MGETAETLLSQSVSDFLDRLADRVPTPGGGAASALAGALASAMAHMVAAYCVEKQSDPAQRKQVALLCDELARADRMLRRLVHEDVAAYEQLRRASRIARDDPQQADEKNRAVALALAVPLEMAAVASGAIAVMNQVQPFVGKHLLSDLGVAAVLADACARAAAYTVRVNAAQLPDEAQRREVLGQITSIVGRTGEIRQALESSLPAEIRP